MAKKKNTEGTLVYIPKTEAAEKAASAVFWDGETVLVALCHPQGIVFPLANNDGKKYRVKLNGNAADLIGKPKGVLPQGGFGLTTVKKTDWELIVATYGGMEIFKNGLCFAADDKASLMSEMDEKDEVRHGREPVKISDAQTEAVESAAAAAL